MPECPHISERRQADGLAACSWCRTHPRDAMPNATIVNETAPFHVHWIGLNGPVIEGFHDRASAEARIAVLEGEAAGEPTLLEDLIP